jgi:hypothetical protein
MVGATMMAVGLMVGVTAGPTLATSAGRTIGGQLATFGSAPQRRYFVVSTWNRRKA